MDKDIDKGRETLLQGHSWGIRVWQGEENVLADCNEIKKALVRRRWYCADF